MTVLIDTCVLIYIAGDKSISAIARRAIDDARKNAAVLVSPISAWELGVQVNDKGKLTDWLEPTALQWFERFLKIPGIMLAPFDYRIAMKSTSLPGTFHRDPADRFLVSTARQLDCAIITRDLKILDYATQGHVKAIAC
jgi:PIN domain nuclease of toxin-antitoxin system